MELYVHVGAQKTGTTALQFGVFPFLRDTAYVRYLQRDIVYSDLSDSSRLLWSYEDLAGTPHLNARRTIDNREAIARNIHAVFPRARIIVGTRQADTWIRSLYREAVRQGTPLTWSEFQTSFDTKYADWDSYIAQLRELFEHVHVYRFEDLERDPSGVVAGICEFMGTEMTRPLALSRTNERLSERRLRLLIRLNRLFRSEAYNPDGYVSSRYAFPLRRLWRRVDYPTTPM